MNAKAFQDYYPDYASGGMIASLVDAIAQEQLQLLHTKPIGAPWLPQDFPACLHTCLKA